MRFRTLRRTSTGGGRPSFTDAARDMLERARSEATRLGHEYCGTEHIVLALLQNGTPVHAIIRSLGADADAIRRDIEALCPVGRVHMVHLPYTSRAKKVLELASDEAMVMQASVVDVQYLLLGVLLEQKGIGAQVLLRDRRITVDAVREAIRNPLPAGFRVLLSDSSELPLAEQIVVQVEEAIATGQLKAGDRLPTVRSLADELSIAPGTVARAYAELEKRGAVKTDGARGTTVAQRPPAPMDATARVMMLSGLLRPVAVEGFHVGATADELREALERAIGGVQLDGLDGTA